MAEISSAAQSSEGTKTQLFFFQQDINIYFVDYQKCFQSQKVPHLDSSSVQPFIEKKRSMVHRRGNFKRWKHVQKKVQIKSCTQVLPFGSYSTTNNQANEKSRPLGVSYTATTVSTRLSAESTPHILIIL